METTRAARSTHLGTYVRTAIRLTYPALLTIMACWSVFRLHGRPLRGIDDAQILFSYSTNLAAGYGLVYANNPEHVEGVTSLLWTLICVIPFRLGLNESGVLAISILLLCVTQILILDIIRRSTAARRFPSWPFELAYLSIVLSCPAYITWMSITLMDTCLWGLLIVLMLRVALQPPHTAIGAVIASIPFFLSPLCRPEALLVAPTGILLAWLQKGGDQEARRRLTLVLTTAVVISVAAVTIFRLSYFGYPLPNTYYAKVSPSLAYNLKTGTDYLCGYATQSGLIIGVFVLFLMGLAAWSTGSLAVRISSYLATHRWTPPLVANWQLSALFAVILLFTPVLTGGDHFLMFRFYQPAYPVMTLALVLLVVACIPAGASGYPFSALKPKRYLIPACCLCVLLASWTYRFLQQPSWSSFRVTSPLQYQFSITERGIRMGERLNDFFTGAAALPTVGVYQAGGVARTYHGRIVDLMGLTTTQIAHYRGDRKGRKNHAAFEKEAFFKLGRIDVLLASPPVPPETVNFASYVLRGLLDDPRFVRNWRYGLLRSSWVEADTIQAFYSTGFVDSLEATARFHFVETMTWSSRWTTVDSTGVAGTCH